MAETPRTLTIVIPTHQRREALAALLESLRPQLAAEPEGIDVAVVVDGSTDGSAEYAAGLRYPVPIIVATQPNAGLAAARNRGLQEGEGELVWFLDDDMVAADGLVARHRRAHADGTSRLLMGPCPVPPELEVVPMVREWAAEQYAELAAAGRLERAVHFLAANTSGPRSTWLGVGGFDERFVGWGAEDYEIAVRLLAAGVEVAYDADAVAWHHQQRGIAGFCATKRDEGRNTVRIARKLPATADELLPPRAPGRRTRALRLLARGGPAALGAAARAAAAAAVAEARVAPRQGRRALRLAATLSFLAGVAELDAGEGYLARVLGDGSERPSRRDSSHPSSSPTGSQ
jgi:GT2 family glycosyltransferase